MNGQTPGARPRRRHDLDRLRILAVLLLIPFHSARVYNGFRGVPEPFYVKAGVISEPLSWFGALLSIWHMPLLFVLAGAATWFALGFRDAGRYVSERTKRLLIPFLFGSLVIVPPQAWMAQLDAADAVRSYPAFLPRYLLGGGDLRSYEGDITPAHLWFILYLFVYSLAALPLFLRWRESGFVRRAGPWFIPAVMLAGLATRAFGLGAPDPLWHLVQFVAGFVIAGSERLQEVIRTRWLGFLWGAVATTAVVASVWAWGPEEGWPSFSPPDIAFTVLREVATWLSVLALLAMAERFMSGETPWLGYANQAAYPVYILHQTVIVAVAYLVLGWGWGPLEGFTAIAMLSAVLTLALYHVAVRPLGPVRLLFGMKARSIQYQTSRRA